MSRLSVVTLVSLVAAAGIALHDSTRRSAVADGPTPRLAERREAPAAATALRRPSSADERPASSARATSAPRAPRSAYGTWALVVSFAGGAGLAVAAAWWFPAIRRRFGRTARNGAGMPVAPGAVQPEWHPLSGDVDDLVTLHDAEGFIRYASGSLLELTGHAPNELIGRQGRDLVHPDDLPMLLAAVHAAHSEPDAAPTMFRVRDSRGRYIWLEAELRHSVSRTGEPEMACVARSVARTSVAVSTPAAARPVRRAPASAVLDDVHGPSLQDLCHAFERREFSLHYQLKVGLATWEVTGVEALLRWNAPEGSGKTAEIIASAERSGFIVTLGEWVVRAAAHQSLEWRRAGLLYPVSVNISPVQLHDPRFVSLMRELIAKDRQLPAYLQLEITEKALAANADRPVQTIAQLVALGFTLHVDDFGTGYSQLAQLSRMPVRALKIDRSFVLGLSGSRHAGEIVRAVVSLARALGVKVIAEGVETAEQLEFLRACGCDEVQGFLFSRPMSADAVQALSLPPPDAARTRTRARANADD